MHVLIETTFGNLKILLLTKKAPITTRNFIDLALGQKEFINHLTGAHEKKPFYNGLTFHRVVKDIIVQTGCPYGNSDGGPGFMFDDEIDLSTNKHNKAGLVSMANIGPNTNGSQFFITLSPMPWLDKKHTIFGEVADGLNDLIKMTNTIEVIGDTPKIPPKIISISML